MKKLFEVHGTVFLVISQRNMEIVHCTERKKMVIWGQVL
jgi:hypothetical protein